MIRTLFISLLLSAFGMTLFAQHVKPEAEGFKFTDKIVLPATGVKDQSRTGTCWSFSAISMLESEMLRLNKPSVDLSEMFIVYHAYNEKAEKYVRMHGLNNFDAGGSFHDVTNMIRKFGVVPESVYSGLNYGEEKHVHNEMDQLLKDQMTTIVKNPNKKLSTVWSEAVASVLNAYLGKVPERFEYEGKSFSPQSFARDFVGLNMDDYVEVTSFSHHPFYTKFILEVPDNWSWDGLYNVPLPELEEIIDYSLSKGYSVAWASDVSEKGFLSSNKGVAMVPVKKTTDMTDTERARWEKLTSREKEEETYKFDQPVPELEITQELRQIAFNDYETTDDHGMHIIGLAVDQNGKEYYKTKNSWGDYNMHDGFFYASKAYVKYKTTSIMVHKDGIPMPVRKKLNL